MRSYFFTYVISVSLSLIALSSSLVASSHRQAMDQPGGRNASVLCSGQNSWQEERKAFAGATLWSFIVMTIIQWIGIDKDSIGWMQWVSAGLSGIGGLMIERWLLRNRDMLIISSLELDEPPSDILLGLALIQVAFRWRVHWEAKDEQATIDAKKISQKVVKLWSAALLTLALAIVVRRWIYAKADPAGDKQADDRQRDKQATRGTMATQRANQVLDPPKQEVNQERLKRGKSGLRPKWKGFITMIFLWLILAMACLGLLLARQNRKQKKQQDKVKAPYAYVPVWPY